MNDMYEVFHHGIRRKQVLERNLERIREHDGRI